MTKRRAPLSLKTVILKKIWVEQRGRVRFRREGWYLFGWLPLYVRDMSPRGIRFRRTQPHKLADLVMPQ